MTKFLENREEQKRMRYRPGIDPAPVFAASKEPAMFEREIGWVKALQNKLLGELPDTAFAASDLYEESRKVVREAAAEMTTTLERASKPSSGRTVAFFDNRKP